MGRRVADREPRFPRVKASPEVFLQHCRDPRPAFVTMAKIAETTDARPAD